MNIIELYERYGVPENLQLHMLRVAGVGKVITANIKVNLDTSLLIKGLLLHDMGNIMKFDFNNTSMLTQRDKNRVEELRRTQERFGEKYGKNADEVTAGIIEEAKGDKRLIELCATSHGDHAAGFDKQGDWERKIMYYADMRVGPNGVIQTKARFDDLIERYPKEKKFGVYMKQCLEIEAQLSGVMLIKPESINNEMVESKIKILKSENI